MTINCNWCHRENPVEREFCLGCEHNPQKPRRECNCFRCKERWALAAQVMDLYNEEREEFEGMFDKDIKKRFEEIGEGR